MSFRQRPPVTIEELLKRTDEQIKNYVSFVFNSHPDKVALLKDKLNAYLANLNEQLLFSEKKVTDGSFGYSSTKEEAAQKLRGWANGTMQKDTIELIAKFKKDLRELELKMAAAFPSVVPREHKEDDQPMGIYFDTMKELGKMYVDAETTKQKATLALDHLSTLQVAALATASVKPESPRPGK